MKIVVYTSFDCLIKMGNIEETLEQNQNLSLDESQLPLLVYPVGKNPLPAFKIDLKETSSPYYRLVEKDDKILIFLIGGIYAKNIKISHISFEGHDCQIEVDRNEISFVCNRNKKTISVPKPILSSTCGNFYHIAYAKIDCQNFFYLFAYNMKNLRTKVFEGEKIELTENGFVVTSSAHGYKSITAEYKVDTDGLKIKERKFSALSIPIFQQTLALRFLNAVKHCDYDFALSLLSDNLKSHLSPNTLKEYFGDISYVFPLDETTCFALSNNKNVVYNFSIENNKISEINDNL